MAEPRNFDEEFDYSSRKGQSFILGGLEFHTKAIAPPAAFLTDSRGLKSAIDFFQAVLVPEDVEVFNRLIADPDVLISAHQLDQIAAWLIEETSGRPTESPAQSGSGRGRGSRTSKVASLGKDKTGTG